MKFFMRSLLILFALYALVFAIGDAYLAKLGAPPAGALVFVIVLVGVQYLIAPWLIEHILDIHWEEYGAQLPAPNRAFVEQLCSQRGLKVPRIGIINSGTPNAFSFGRVRSDARVVVTSGLLDVLTPEEANAVLAHEIGHIEHWDFVVMTIAGLVPVLLYQLYVFTRDVKNVRAIAYSAYLCYWVSQYIVLLLNRTREYFADHYAAEATGMPDALSSALIKIAYGMVKADGAYREAKEFKYKEKSELRREERQRLAGCLEAFPLPVRGNEGYATAEVTGGGVPLEEVHVPTLESRAVAGLYLVGEMLDAVGRIGGYNFLWAWVTGRKAGLALAEARRADAAGAGP